jgi:hypothetical protein
MKLQTKVGAAGKKMKGLLFWGNLGARCGNIEAKIFQSLACLGKDFQVTSPPKIFACQFPGDTLLSSFFRNI